MKLFCLMMSLFLISLSCASQSVDEIKKEMILGLELPKDAYPVETIDEWFPNGDGYYLARYSLNAKAFEKLKSQVELARKYILLPFGDEIIDDLIFEYVEDDDVGYYKLIYNRNDKRDIKMTLLNETKKELIIFISFQ